MKKVLCVLVLICVIMGAAFAQQKSAAPAPAAAAKQNAFGVDLFQLVKGFIASDSDSDFSIYIAVVNYERLVKPHFSIGADLDIYFITFGSGKESVDSKYFNISAEGRYYPLSNSFEKIFVGTTLGYSQLSIDGKSKPENGGFSGLSTSLKIGYKYIAENGLYVEPSMAYILQKSSDLLFGLTPLGWNAGFRLGYAF